MCRLLKKVLLLSVILALFCNTVKAYNLSPISFNNFYHIASEGDLQGLKDVERRGLNLNATNQDGDTAVCVAVKKKDYLAYKTLIRAGAKSHPSCLENVPEYAHKDFLANYNKKYAAPQTPINWQKVVPATLLGVGAGAGVVALIGVGGGGGSGGSSDTSGDSKSCEQNKCAEGCFENQTCSSDEICMAYNTCGGCTKCEKSDICKSNSCAKGCFNNLTCQDGYTCAQNNKCGGCERCVEKTECQKNACAEGCYTNLKCGTNETCTSKNMCGGCTKCSSSGGSGGNTGGDEDGKTCNATNYPLTTKPDETTTVFSSCQNGNQTRYRITGCKTGYYLNNGNCVKNQTIENCQQYSPIDNTCIQCNTGYELNKDGTCTKSDYCYHPDDAESTTTKEFDCDLKTEYVFVYCTSTESGYPYYYTCIDRNNTSGCTEFSEQSDSCTACADGYKILNGVCVKTNNVSQKNNDKIVVTADDNDTVAYKCADCTENGIIANGYNAEASIEITVPEEYNKYSEPTYIGMLNETNCSVANSYYDNESTSPNQAIITTTADSSFGTEYSSGLKVWQGIAIQNTGTGTVYNSFYGNGLISNFSTGIYSTSTGTVFNAHGGTGTINAFGAGIITETGNVINAYAGGTGIINVDGTGTTIHDNNSSYYVFSELTGIGATERDITANIYLINAYGENSKGVISVNDITGNQIASGIYTPSVGQYSSDDYLYTAINAYGNNSSGSITISKSNRAYGIAGDIAINSCGGGTGTIEVHGDNSYGLYGTVKAHNSIGEGKGTISMYGSNVVGIYSDANPNDPSSKTTANGINDEINIYGSGIGVASGNYDTINGSNFNRGNINIYHTIASDGSVIKGGELFTTHGGQSFGMFNGYNQGQIYINASETGTLIGMLGDISFGDALNEGQINIISSANNTIYGMHSPLTFNDGKINIITTGNASAVYGIIDAITDIKVNVAHGIYNGENGKIGEININIGGNVDKVMGIGPFSDNDYVKTLITNKGNITIRSTSGKKISNVYGIYSNHGSIYNYGNITLENVDENTSYGIYAINNSKVYNSGTITINGNSYSGNVANGHFIYIDESSSITTDGTISTTSAISTTSLGGGKLVMAKNGKIDAPVVSGEVTAAADITTGSFDKTYTSTAFTGDTSQLSVVSDSALFDANIEGQNIVMSMKDFASEVKNKSAALYLQQNYNAQKKLALFDALKAQNSTATLNKAVAQDLGYSLLPNFAQENLNLVRSLSNLVTDTMYAQDQTNERMMVGYDYLGQDRSSKGDITGYENTANSSYFLADVRLDNHQRFGLGVALTRFNSDYDDDSTRKATIAQVLGSYMYDFGNHWQYAGVARFGYADGEYKRQIENTRIEGDTSDILYGLNNELRYTYDLGFITLEPQVELNAYGYYQRTIKEDSQKDLALRVDGTNNLSVESGAGFYVTKETTYGENSLIKGRLGGSYYREWSQPYHSMRAHLYDTDGNYLIRAHDIFDRNRFVARADISCRWKAFDFYLRGSQFMEDKHTTVINAGIKYNF